MTEYKQPVRLFESIQFVNSPNCFKKAETSTEVQAWRACNKALPAKFVK
jgi:hypothetical protein